MCKNSRKNCKFSHLTAISPVRSNFKDAIIFAANALRIFYFVALAISQSHEAKNLANFCNANIGYAFYHYISLFAINGAGNG